MKNILERALKTFVEAFLGLLIPELVTILNNGFPESWSVFWAVIAPFIAGALGAGISAAWNTIENHLKEKEDGDDNNHNS